MLDMRYLDLPFPLPILFLVHDIEALAMEVVDRPVVVLDVDPTALDHLPTVLA
jgi:hypothetical protein